MPFPPHPPPRLPHNAIQLSKELQAREGREGQQKTAALERSLQQVLSDFKTERQMVMQKSQEQLAQAEAESISLKRLIK